MKLGIYLNTHKDTANLIYFSEDGFEDGDAVKADDYDLQMEVSADGNIRSLTFGKLEYLGKL